MGSLLDEIKVGLMWLKWESIALNLYCLKCWFNKNVSCAWFYYSSAEVLFKTGSLRKIKLLKEK